MWDNLPDRLKLFMDVQELSNPSQLAERGGSGKQGQVVVLFSLFFCCWLGWLDFFSQSEARIPVVKGCAGSELIRSWRNTGSVTTMFFMNENSYLFFKMSLKCYADIILL